MKKTLLSICLLSFCGMAVAQNTPVAESAPVAITLGATNSTTVADKKPVAITLSNKGTTATPTQEKKEEKTKAEKPKNTDKKTSSKKKETILKVKHTTKYAPYAPGMDIQAFLSALEGSEIGAYLVRQYYQPADTPEKHCFIMTPLDEAKEYKVKKCVQLQPTVIFKENDLYKILGID